MTFIPTGPPVFAYGSTTGPASAAQIAATVALTGTYDVLVTLYIDGVTAAVDDDNMLIRINGVNNVQALPAASPEAVQFRFFFTSANSAVIVRASATATATAVYHASIIATPYGED